MICLLGLDPGQIRAPDAPEAKPTRPTRLSESKLTMAGRWRTGYTRHYRALVKQMQKRSDGANI